MEGLSLDKISVWVYNVGGRIKKGIPSWIVFSFANFTTRKEVRKVDEKRRNEIAYLLWKRYFSHRPIPFDSLKRELGNVAKEIGVPLPEVTTFFTSLYEELVKEAFE